MTDFNTFKFGFIGLGLIGGSIARAIRQQWPDAQIIAYNPSKDTLQEARQDGVVNYGNSDEDVQLINQAMGSSRPFIGNIFSDCDIVFLCAPVQKNAENLAEVVPYLKSSAILTDIGSTKTDIHTHVRELDEKMKSEGFQSGIASRFIGGHPMTGSERTKYRNSKAQLLENAYYIIAPEAEVPQEKTALFRSFVEGVRAIPLILDCAFHDFAVGAVQLLW